MDFEVVEVTYEVEEKLSAFSILPFVIRVNTYLNETGNFGQLIE